MLAASGDVAANWAQVVLALGVVGGATLGLHRWLKKHVADPLKEVPIIGAKVARIEGTLAPIAAQFERNHGTSLRDSNDRTEAISRSTARRLGIDVDREVPSEDDTV